MIQVLAKGLAVISLFDVLRPEWTVEEISEATGFPRMTVYRLVKTMESLRFLVCDATNRYHLGPGLLAAGRQLSERYADLVKVARPYLEDLASRTQEMVTLAVEVDRVPVEVDEIFTSRPFTRPHAIGRVFGYTNTAHGKIFLASKSPVEREKIELETTTPQSIVDREILYAELERVFQEGVAFNYQERDIGICAVAAPVRDQAGKVVASMAVLAPPGRFTTDQRGSHAEAVKATAASLSAFLGFLAAPAEG
jgi:IclR family transcriptional regulator, pca regulon regulatory protein